METRIVYALGLLLLALQSCRRDETPFKIGFETIEQDTKLPRNWFIPNEPGDYSIYADSLNAFSGKRSLLLENRSPKGHYQFITGMVRIPVDFNGSKVTLTGFIKTENAKGNAGMILRIEGDAGQVMMENMRAANVAGTTDWKQYEISLPLNNGAREIYIGVYNSGSGKIWADDLEIRMDGKTPDAGERITLPPALKDTAFLTASRVVIDSLSPGSLNDLVVLARIWGFLKYYHPAVAAGQHNWDAELFRILPGIIAASSKSDRNAIMLNWIKGLKKIEGANKKPAITDSGKVKLQPDVDWLADREELGDSLSEELEVIKRSSWNTDHFYVDLEYRRKMLLLMNESSYYFLHFPDDGYRLLALYRYWNIIQYYYPYKHLIGENWTDVLTRFIPQFIHADSPEAYQLTLLKMIAAIHDSHGNLTGRTLESDRFIGSYFIDAAVRFIEGKPTIISVLKEAGDQADNLLIGDVILKVNGKTVKEIQDRLAPFISASTEAQKLHGIASRMLGGNDSMFFMEVERGGRTVALKINSNAGRYIKPAPSLQSEPWSFLPGDVGYVFPGKLRKDDIPQMMGKFQLSTRAIVIDLRCYPLEIVGEALCTYFADKPVEFVKPSFASIQRPGMFDLQPAWKVGDNNALSYKGKLIVLVNEFTESRAEYLAMALKAMPNVTVIGNNTAGTDGDASEFFLPGGLKTRITGVGYYWPDGAETQRIGIIPDIIVQPTLKGIRAGKDEVLDFALSYIKR